MVQINVGANANDGTGDTLRAAFQKVNANTTELGTSITTSSDSTFNTVKIGLGGGNKAESCAVGYLSLYNNLTGLNNSIFGTRSGFNLNSNNNSMFGYYAGESTVSGSENSFFGTQAGRYTNSGSRNSFFGNLGGVNNLTFNNCSGLGYNAAVTGDNQVQLGNSTTTTYVYGTVQNRSDLRDKSDVQNTVLGLEFISKLRPVDYKWDMRESYKSELPIQGELSDEDFKVVINAWLEENKLSNLKHDGSKKRNRFHHGFIAQEVKDLGFGGFQDHSVNGGEDVLSIGYDEFIAPMVKAIQELKAEIELLKMK